MDEETSKFWVVNDKFKYIVVDKDYYIVVYTRKYNYFLV